MSHVHVLNRSEPNDEFYTRLESIEEEVPAYAEYLVDKVVYCNCDHPLKSNFVRWFAGHFNELHLKKLICTCYAKDTQQLSMFEKAATTKDKALKGVVTHVPSDWNGDIQELFSMNGNELCELAGNGDFRSKECVELLDQSDVVITNPPFSMSIEFIRLMLRHKKKFLVLSNLNIIKHRLFFEMFVNQQLFFGVTSEKKRFWFVTPKNSGKSTKHKEDTKVDEDGNELVHLSPVRWFTNMNNNQQPEPWVMTKEYLPSEYPEYDNFNAIEIAHIHDIPKDYYGVMGVPIVFACKWNREQFEIVSPTTCAKNNTLSLSDTTSSGKPACCTPSINGKQLYSRILIRRKQ